MKNVTPTRLLVTIVCLVILVGLLSVYRNSKGRFSDRLRSSEERADGRPVEERFSVSRDDGPKAASAVVRESNETRENIRENPEADSILEISVVDGESLRGVGHVRLELGGTEIQNYSLLTDEDGFAEAEIRPGSTCQISVVEVPPPYIRPSFSGQIAPDNHRDDGWFPRQLYDSVVVFETEVSKVELQVLIFKSSIVRGKVAYRNRPIVAAPIRLSADTIGLQAIKKRTQTDAIGTFVFEGVEPGFYKLNVLYPQGENSDQVDSSCAVPTSREFEVLPGQVCDLGTLEYGEGRAEVRGRVVDESFEAVPDAFVMIYPIYPTREKTRGRIGPTLAQSSWWGSTSSDGTFRIVGLEALEYRLIVEPWDFEKERRKLAYSPDPILIDARVANVVTIDQPIVIHRSQPFSLDLVTEGDAKECVVTIRPEELSKIGAIEYNGRQPLRVVELNLDEQGRGSWRCETPHARMCIEVRKRGHDDVLLRRIVTPIPNVTEQVHLEFPLR